MSHPTPDRVKYPTWLKTGANSRVAHYHLCRYLTLCELRNPYSTSPSNGLKAKPCTLCTQRLLSMSYTQEDIDKIWATALSSPK